MSTTPEPRVPWQTWEICRLCPEKDRQAGDTCRQTVEIQHAFDRTMLQNYCLENRIPAIKIYQVAWAIVVGAYVGTDEVCSGFVSLSQCSSRPAIYRCLLGSGQSITHVVGMVDEQAIESSTTSADPIYAVEQAAKSTGIFDTILSIMSNTKSRADDFAPQNGTIEASAIHSDSISNYTQSALHAQIQEARATITIDFSTSVIANIQANSMAECLCRTIYEIVNGPERTLGDLDIVSDRDRYTIHNLNSKDLGPYDRCVHQLFEGQAGTMPEAPAICSWDGDFTYRELDDMSSCLGKHLRTLGVGKDVIVPFHFHKSSWTVVAMLATIKAGGAPVALNPDFPLERLMHIIHFTRAHIVVVGTDLRGVIEDPALTIVGVDWDLLSTLPSRSVDFHSSVQPNDAAFVLFTSGSTGIPKGIVIEHGAYCAGAVAQHSALKIDRFSRVLQFAAHSFDATLLEIFTPLMAGGCVCIPSEERRVNDLAGAINDMRVNWACLTPTLAKILRPLDVPGLRTLGICGEVASKDVIDLWVDEVDFLNIYGPAECSVISSVNNISKWARHPTNIGRALQASNLWIVSPSNHTRLAPMGAIGELLVQGPTVGRGYLYDPERTASAFVEDLPWLIGNAATKYRKAYRTGDLVRYMPDGTLEFIGRKDTQVKLRGQRIELGEIEHQLNINAPSGASAAVEVVKPAYRPVQQLLIAFQWPPKSSWQHHQSPLSPLIPSSAKARAEMIELEYRLSRVLPSFMIPTVYLPLAFMPATPSGKVDRKMLRTLASELSEEQMAVYSLTSTAKQIPTTDMEHRLQCLWAKVLGLDTGDIGTADNFFWLGGNSITAMRLTVAARAEGISVTVADILRHPRLPELASIANFAIEQDKPTYAPFSSLQVTHVGAFIRDFVCPRLSVDFSNIQDVSKATDYQTANIGWMPLKRRGGTNYVTLDFLNPICPEQLKSACNQLVAHYAILRTVFLVHRREVFQVVLKEIPLSITDHQCHRSVEHSTAAIIEEDMCRPLDPGEVVVRFMFLCRDKGVNRLVLRASHAQYDGHALIRICKDLGPAYLGGTLTPTSDFIEYMQFAAGRPPEEAEHFWRNLLAGSSVTQILRHSKPSFRNVLDGAINKLIPTRLTRSHDDITIATTIKAAWSIVLAEVSGKTDLVFGSTTWGRSAPFPGVENVVGPCLGHIPVRVRLHPDMTALDLLRSVQEQYISAIPFESFGFKRIVESCTDWRKWERLSSIVLYQNLDDGLESISIDKNTVKMGEVRPPADRADITVYAQPCGSDTLVELNFCKDVLPLQFVRELLERLCFHIQNISADVHALVALPQGGKITYPWIPLDGNLLDGYVSKELLQPSTDGKVFEDGKHDKKEPCFCESYNSSQGTSPPRPKHAEVREGVIGHCESVYYTTQPTSKAEKPKSATWAKIEEIVKDAWTSSMACEPTDLKTFSETHTPFFDVWGNIVASYALAKFYSRQGFDVAMEDILENPTMALQTAFLYQQPRDPVANMQDHVNNVRHGIPIVC